MRKPTGNGGSPLGPRGFGVVPRLEELVADPWQVSVLDAHTARLPTAGVNPVSLNLS
jgi:hypothetical protein